MRVADPEFSDDVPPKPKSAPSKLPARLVRRILYAHAFAALLSSSNSIAHVVRAHGLIDPKLIRQYAYTIETVSTLALLTAFVFPALVGWAVSRPEIQRWKGVWAIVATVALAVFQLFAAIPGFQ